MACAACFALLAVLAYDVVPAGHLDARILNDLSASQGSPGHLVASWGERLADWVPEVILVVSVCLIALLQGRYHRAIAAVALVGGGAIVAQLLKVALANPRYQPILGDHQIAEDGFPSGHASGAVTMAVATLLVAPSSWRSPMTAIGIALTLVVSASVVVLHLHFPSDVLGGWLVAAAWCATLVAIGLVPSPIRTPGRKRDTPAVSR
jgi:membrane-associated phospholipid phosphatase